MACSIGGAYLPQWCTRDHFVRHGTYGPGSRVLPQYIKYINEVPSHHGKQCWTSSPELIAGQKLGMNSVINAKES